MNYIYLGYVEYNYKNTRIKGYYYFATFTAAVICPVVIGFIVGKTNYNMIHIFALCLIIVAFFCMRKVRHGEHLSEQEEKAMEAAIQAAENA